MLLVSLLNFKAPHLYSSTVHKNVDGLKLQDNIQEPHAKDTEDTIDISGMDEALYDFVLMDMLLGFLTRPCLCFNSLGTSHVQQFGT